MAVKISKNPRLVIYAWFVCSLAAFFYCYEYLLRIEPSVMVTPLMHHYHITAAGLGFLVAMYYWAYTPLQAVVGLLTDYFGPKRALTIAIGFCALGSLLFAATGSVYVAAAGRLLIGAGSAFAFVGILKLAAMWLPRNRFALFAGLSTALGMLGAMIGDVAVSRLVNIAGWHKVIIWSGVFGLVLIPVFIFFVHEKKAKISSKDHKVYSLRQAGQGLLAAVKHPQILIAGLIGCMLYLSLSVNGEMWGIPFMRTLTHGSKVFAGELNSMIFLGWLLGAPLAGWLSDHLKTRRGLLIVGPLLSALAYAPILIWPDLSNVIRFISLFLFGLFASVEVICFVIARDSLPLKFAATGIGVINLLVMLGGMIFQPLVGLMLDWRWHGRAVDGIRMYGVNDYRRALVLIPIGLILASLAAFLIKDNFKGKTTI